MDNKIIALILAAGKGTRLSAKATNKVLLKLQRKQLILYPVELLERLHIPVYVVVGFKKEDVKKILRERVSYIEQKEQLGTGAAVLTALAKLPIQTKDILVMFGDHAFFYTPELIRKLLAVHKTNKAAITLLTIITNSPHRYGRVMRDSKGIIKEIVEERHLISAQKEIKEVISGLYCFQTDFLRKYKGQLKQRKETGEYYLGDFVAIAKRNGEKIAELKSSDERLAQGINTLADLELVERLVK